MGAGRRRTDAPDALWQGNPAALSDSPTDPGRGRGGRPVTPPLPNASRTPESGRQVSRSRLPLPPVPTSGTGPRTTAAPFRAVPHPEPRLDIPGPARAGDALIPAPVPVGAGAPAERAGRLSAGAPAPAPVASRPSRTWQDEEALVATDPGLGGAARTSRPVPRVPRQTTPSGTPSPAYGDWTRPSRAGDGVRDLDDDHLSGPIPPARTPRVPAPATTAIPERSVAGRRERAADDVDEQRADASRSSRGPAAVSGPVTGGRAALRAERQAAEAARKKAAKRNGTGARGPRLDEDGARPKPRRVAMGLVAMAVVALGVLGVYSFASPGTKEAASQASAATTAAPVAAAPTSALPALPTEPVAAEPTTAAAPVRVPVTVLNATAINGLAKKISSAVVGAGWEAPGVGAYKAGDVAASTVFFTQGDETQRQAAVQLVNQFPQLQGPTPRFFDLPEGVSAQNLVIVATGDWQP